MGTIAVIGATGTIGGRLARRLAEQGRQVRAICRNPGDWDSGVEVVSADLTDPEQALGALEGAEGVYLTPTLGGDDLFATELSIAHNVVDAALKHNVSHLVMHTAVRADRGDTGARILDNKTPIEARLAESGIGYTILRPAWFFQNLWAARAYLEQGVVSMPWPEDMVWAATDVEDVVTAAVSFFEMGPANRGFDIHVPSGITGRQIAQAATAVLGRPVEYHEARVSSREYVAAFPLSEAHKDAYAELFDYFRATTYLGDPQPIVGTLAGFRPRGIEQFLREELFAG